MFKRVYELVIGEYSKVISRERGTYEYNRWRSGC